MKQIFTVLYVITLLSVAAASAETVDTVPRKRLADRFSVTGYVEIAAMRSFDRLGEKHSDPTADFPAWNLNLPKASVWAEFDCGKGWTLGTQIEFCNNGSAPIRGIGDADSRPMDWSQDLELSELWVQKRFSDAANLKVGLIGTPVGRQNDMPTQFFGVIRPEDGPGYLALNNQSPAIDFNGKCGPWAYDVMFIPGFVSYDYGNEYWRHGLDGTYTQTVDRLYAGAFRVDNSSVPGLTIGLSGEAGGGHTWLDCGEEEESVRRGLKSTVLSGSLDREYDANNVIFRGACQYGRLWNEDETPELAARYGDLVDMQAVTVGAELGYDFFALNDRLSASRKFYVFGRYDMASRQEENPTGKRWDTGQRFSIGVNWFPIPDLIVKAEWGCGFDADPARTFAGISAVYQW